MVAAYFPLAHPGPFFWNTEFLRLVPRYDAIAPVVGGTLLTWFSIALVRRPLALAYYLIGSLGLLAFFYVKFDGYLRHHGYLFVCFATALWLSRTLPVRDGWGPTAMVARLPERSLVVVVPLLLGIHVAAAAIAVSGEYEYVFSGAKATAELMRQAGVDGLPMVGDFDYAAMPVVGYLDKDRAYYPAGRRFGSNVLWDTRRLNRYDLWGEAASLAQSLNSAVVIVASNAALSRNRMPAWLAPRLQVLGCREGRIVRDESLCVIRLGAP
jgi:hypothetical protein